MGTALTRTNYRSGRDIIKPTYRDIVVDFSKNPVTGALGEITNEVAVAQMMQCLILTNIGSWPFEYNNGSRTSVTLFDPNEAITTTLVSDTIQEAILKYAPMVVLVGLQVTPAPFSPNDAIRVTIAYQLRNIPDIFTMDVTVDRRIR